MPKVTIIKPNITLVEEKEIFENVAYVLEKIVAKECGIKVKFSLERARQ